MNKTIFLLVAIVALVLPVSLFAQAATGDVTVQSVNGVARYEASSGRFEALSVNQRLSANTVINTGLNSSVVLQVDGRPVTIRAMQRGTVANLTGAASSGSSGLRLGASVDDAADSASGRARGNISTASTRAADVMEDLEWAEEEEATKE